MGLWDFSVQLVNFCWKTSFIETKDTLIFSWRQASGFGTDSIELLFEMAVTFWGLCRMVTVSQTIFSLWRHQMGTCLISHYKCCVKTNIIDQKFEAEQKIILWSFRFLQLPRKYVLYHVFGFNFQWILFPKVQLIMSAFVHNMAWRQSTLLVCKTTWR